MTVKIIPNFSFLIPTCFLTRLDRIKTGVIKCLIVKAGVAQLVEQLTCNQQVGGSSPLAGSSEEKTKKRWNGRVVNGNRL